MLEVRHPNLRVIIRIIIFLIYMILALLPGGFMMFIALDHNPQGEFCETTNYTVLVNRNPQSEFGEATNYTVRVNRNYQLDIPGFVFIFPNFVPYDPVKHTRNDTFTFYAPSSGDFTGANWIANGQLCRLQFDELIQLFLPSFLFLSIPAMLIFRAITKNLF